MKLWEYVCSVSIAWTLIAVICGLFVLTVCAIVFSIEISIIGALALLPILMVGAAGYVFFSFLISSLAKNEAHMSMITNLIIFPLLFCSEAFYSLENAPFFLHIIRDVNPVQWFLNGIYAAIDWHIQTYFIYGSLLLLFLLGMIGLSLKTFHYDRSLT